MVRSVRVPSVSDRIDEAFHFVEIGAYGFRISAATPLSDEASQNLRTVFAQTQWNAA